MQPSLSFIKQILSLTVLLFLSAGQLFSQTNYQKLGEWQIDRTDSVFQNLNHYHSEGNNISLVGEYWSLATTGSMNVVYPPSCNGSPDFFVLNLDTNMTFKNCLRFGGKNSVSCNISNFNKWNNDTIVLIGGADFYPDTACEMQSLSHGGQREIWALVSDTLGNVLNERLIGTSGNDGTGNRCLFLENSFTIHPIFLTGLAGDDLWNLPPPCVNCPAPSFMRNLSTFNYGLQKIGEKYIGPLINSISFLHDSINHFTYLISMVNTTQPNIMDVTQAGTGNDIWILKMDEQLNILSDKRLITPFNEQNFNILPSFLPNGNILIWGSTTSYFGAGLQGIPQGGQDLFLYEVDTAGNLINDRCYGTAIDDEIYGVSLLKNGMIMVSAATIAGVSGNKTEPSRGASDAWYLFLDANLNIVYQKTLGGLNSETSSTYGEAAVHEWADGSVLVIMQSASDSTGDKTIPASNPNGIHYDLWLVRFMPGLLTGIDEAGGVPTSPFVFPNPATDEFEIRTQNIRSYSVYQLDGRLITQGKVKNEEAITVSCAKWNQGLYLVEVIKSNGSRMVNKMVKQ